jgi:hypothetical protein
MNKQNPKSAFSTFLKETVNKETQKANTQQFEKDLICEIIEFPIKTNTEYNPSIVTVKFLNVDNAPNTTMPVINMRNGIYYPLKVGDKGIARVAIGNQYIAELSGLGGKGDKVTNNLGNLEFEPAGHVDYSKIKNSANGYFTITVPIANLADYTDIQALKDYCTEVNTVVNALVDAVNGAHNLTLAKIAKTITKQIT